MEIRISKSARQCAASERVFEHGEPIYSRVRIEDGALIREDFAREAWSDALAKTAYSYWSSTFYDPRVAEEEEPERFSPLRRLFYDAVETEERAETAVAFLAAQLLRRQKVFRLIKENTDDESLTTLLFADRIGDRLIEVRDPNLSHTELDDARQRLMTRLADLEQAETPPEADAEPEDAPKQESDVESVEHAQP